MTTRIEVRPGGVVVAFTFTYGTDSTATVYSDEACTTEVTQPVSVSTSTSYYLPAPGGPILVTGVDREGTTLVAEWCDRTGYTIVDVTVSAAEVAKLANLRGSANSVIARVGSAATGPLTVPEGTLVGRASGGSVAALTAAQGNSLLAGSSLVNTVAATGATETLPATYEFHDCTMDENCTFTFTAPSQNGHAFALRLAGAFAPTWPASVKWGGGSAPTYTTPAVYVFVTFDGGTTWKGSQMGKAFA